MAEFSHRCGVWLLVAGSLAALTAGSAAAADCKAFPFSVSQPLVERIVMDPRSLLSDFPTGGSALITRVATITASSNAGTQSVIGIARLANPAQKRAIAEGLVSAARICEKDYPVEARKIELAVAKSPDAPFRKAFRDAFQSEIEREAQSRADRLGDSVKQDANLPNESYRRLFDPFRLDRIEATPKMSAVPPIR